MKRLASIVLAGLLAGGCASAPSKPLKSGKSAHASTSNDSREVQYPLVTKWLENEALVEWQIARLAAACNDVAASTQSGAARREALRLKAAYASSCYAIMSGRSPLVQVLSLTASALLSHQVWVEEGRAASQFGAQSKPVEEAIQEIRNRTRAHALANMSTNELQEVEEMVRVWRQANPGPAVMEFICFEAFAEEYTRTIGKTPDLGGMFGRVTGGALSIEMLGERVLFLLSRMPRLAEWQAEAAAANLLAQSDLADGMFALKQLGQLQRTLPEQLNSLQALDSRLASLPVELAAAVGKQPEVKEALARVEQTSQQIKALEGGVSTLEQSVNTLATQLAQLTSAAQPASLQHLADRTSNAFLVRARSFLLLATACVAALLLFHALLRRWSTRPQPQAGGRT